jgi:hypothetical protein
VQIAEAFVAIRPKVDQGQFQRETTAAVTTGARRAGETAGKEFSQTLRSQLSSVGTSLASVFGVVKFGQGINSAIQQASGLNEQGNRTRVVFEGASDAVLKFADDAAQSIGQSRVQALGAAGDFGALFRSFDIGIPKATEMSLRLTTLASDLASFRDVPVDDALQAIRSGLVGEVEPLRRFGVSLSDVRLREEALRLGLKQTSGQILPAATKAQAAYSIILKDTALAQGDFARTAQSAANTQRRSAAEQANAAADLGQNFLPIYQRITEAVGATARVFGTLPGPVQVGTTAMLGVGVALPLIIRVATAVKDLRAAYLASAAAGNTFAISSARVAQALGAVTAGIGLGVVAGGKLVDIFKGSRPEADATAKSLENLAKTGELSGSALALVGADASQLATDLRKLQQGNLARIFTGNTGAAIRAKADIKSVNDSLIELARTKGPDVARKAFAELVEELRAAGVNVSDVAFRFHPFLNALDDAQVGATRTAPKIATLTDKVLGLTDALGNRKLRLDLDASFDAAQDALGELAEARREAAGQGERSRAAADREADAQRQLADAYDSAADANRNLQDAKRELADFDSGVNQRIRALEREQIVRRRVTTPEDVRQKEIDLLSFDQRTADQRADLQRQVADAERGVVDAAEQVADAQRDVSEAAEARRQVQVDAAQTIADAERNAEQAVLDAAAALRKYAEDAKPGNDVLGNYLERLGLLSDSLDPAGPLNQRLDAFFSKLNQPPDPNALIAQESLRAPGPGSTTPRSISQLPDDAQRRIAGLDPQTRQRVAQLLAGTGTILPTQADLELLRRLGVPGYAHGGFTNWPRHEARLAVLHGQETITPTGKKPPGGDVNFTQVNNFSGGITKTDLDYAGRDAAWRMRRRGREA